MTVLSARQFSMLEFIIHQKEFHMNMAKTLNQQTFGSLIHRKYLKYDKRIQTFIVSQLGLKAFNAFHESKIERKSHNAPLSHYFFDDFKQMRDKVIEIKRRVA